MRAKCFVMEGLAVATDRTGVEVISDKGDHLGPIELVANFLIVLVMPGCASSRRFHAGAKDIYRVPGGSGHVQFPLVQRKSCL